MGIAGGNRPTAAAGKRRRWFLGVEPIVEGGRHDSAPGPGTSRTSSSQVALLGDVTIDLSDTKSAPGEIVIQAYAIVRDVDVTVAAGTHVELFGGVLHGDLHNDVPPVPDQRPRHVVRITGHSVLGDVTVRVAEEAVGAASARQGT